jgi:hypothetical protein
VIYTIKLTDFDIVNGNHQEFAKPRFKYFCTGYYRFGLLTAIHKAMGGELSN